MGIKQSLLIELEKETASTRKMLEVLSDEHLDWRPHEKSMSLTRLATHTVEMTNLATEVIARDTFNFEIDFKGHKFSKVQEIIQFLDEGYERNCAAIERSRDEDWLSEFELKSGDYVIAKMPKVGAVRFLVFNHVYHHRGQLTVYLRLLGLPVPGLYGPSADDRMK
ncbi:DinB family protein [Sphingobacterium sp. SYP-B4668]|uniref:DinB family protein n=1 Tax=Sphingobacterium sp. SYP-B4668 TaxID=2996035 RepID=UPI0022DDE374|nr:DinB family protein [Sphingobacterium sp. SYP-B4668]